MSGPSNQANSLRGLLANVGFSHAVLAPETPEGLQLIDGHPGAEVANGSIIPVLVFDASESETDELLASHDPVFVDQAQPDVLKAPTFELSRRIPVSFCFHDSSPEGGEFR